MINDIVEKENKPSSIHKLAAQNSIYRKAKQISCLHFLLSVVIVIVISFIGFLTDRFAIWVSLYSILILLVGDWLFNYINALKNEAAKVQNYFDLYVYSICWDSDIFGEKPENNIIIKYCKKYEKTYKNYHKLEDWYSPNIANVDINAARLICQKSNCSYDQSLRKSFYNVICTISVISIFLVIVFSLQTNIYIGDLLLYVIAPCCPIIQWFCNNIKQNKESLSNSHTLNNIINETWDRLLRGEAIEEEKIKKNQFRLYMNRKTNPLIPDWFYYKKRDENEDNINYSVDELINEYLSSKEV